jgi:hypothetical protein
LRPLQNERSGFRQKAADYADFTYFIRDNPCNLRMKTENLSKAKSSDAPKLFVSFCRMQWLAHYFAIAGTFTANV